MIAAEPNDDLPFLLRVFRPAVYFHRFPSELVMPNATAAERLAFDQHVLAAGAWVARQGEQATEAA